MKTSNQSAGVIKSYGKITVDSVGPSLNPKKHQAQIRQIVLSTYPGVRPGNSLNDGLFSAEEFNSVEQSFEENRVTWIPVPIGTTVAEVAKRLEALTNARIIRIMSLKPVLTEEQQNAIAKGLSKKSDGSLKTFEDYADQQTVVNQAGDIVLYEGHRQFRAMSFLANGGEDIDLRPTDLLDMQPVQMGGVKTEAKVF